MATRSWRGSCTPIRRSRKRCSTPPGPSTGGQRISSRPVFYFDLGSPYAYLAAERVSGLFAEAGLQQPEWEPILLGGLFKRFDRSSWGTGDDRARGMAEIERRASGYGMPPISWPDPWPGDMLFAMRAATFAKRTGRTVAFALAAFRQAFAAGRDLGEIDNVLIAAAACELHPTAVLKGARTDALRHALREATDRAGDLGVRGVPAIAVGEDVFWGDDRLEDAVEAAG